MRSANAQEVRLCFVSVLPFLVRDESKPFKLEYLSAVRPDAFIILLTESYTLTQFHLLIPRSAVSTTCVFLGEHFNPLSIVMIQRSYRLSWLVWLVLTTTPWLYFFKIF